MRLEAYRCREMSPCWVSVERAGSRSSSRRCGCWLVLEGKVRVWREEGCECGWLSISVGVSRVRSARPPPKIFAVRSHFNGRAQNRKRCSAPILTLRIERYTSWDESAV